MLKLPFLICLLFSPSVFAQATTKIACVGASITYGARLDNRNQDSYPAQLQSLLSSSYQVMNYGVSGSTLLRKGDLPYWTTPQYQSALNSQPDVVIIDLGGNDSKLINRTHLSEFETDYQEFIQSFAQLPTHPRIILLLAMPSFVQDTTGIWDPVIVRQINPRIQEVAYKTQVEVFDTHAIFIDQKNHMPDQIHPDKQGASRLAEAMYTLLSQPRDKAFAITKTLSIPARQSSFYGYNCLEFAVNGRSCKLVQPKFAAKGHPWVWRARFWGHEPQTDIALLQQGFHVAYCDVAELLGNAESIMHWNAFYKMLRQAGLAQKAVLEGMSRGGVYVFNWAAVNPEKVACVYVDNPLLNIPDWAEGVMANSGVTNPMFEAFKADYQLTTDEQVRNFRGSPVDKVAQIRKGHYPILIICADEDEAVSPQQNTLLFEEKIKALKGDILVIHKPGFKHHPHSLPNPTPIVDFMLKATGYTIAVPQGH